jgi:hypothetical protein
VALSAREAAAVRWVPRGGAPIAMSQSTATHAPASGAPASATKGQRRALVGRDSAARSAAKPCSGGAGSLRAAGWRSSEASAASAAWRNSGASGSGGGPALGGCPCHMSRTTKGLSPSAACNSSGGEALRRVVHASSPRVFQIIS